MLSVYVECVCSSDYLFLLFVGRHSSDVGGKDTESESESSQKSTTGRDFEMVEREDAEDL